MPRWAKAVGWGALLWTAAIALAAAIFALSTGCGDVVASDLHVCELDRASTISGLALVWFIGFLPLGAVWLLARVRRERCRICGDELGSSERRVCRRCGTRLIESATHGE